MNLGMVHHQPFHSIGSPYSRNQHHLADFLSHVLHSDYYFFFFFFFLIFHFWGISLLTFLLTSTKSADLSSTMPPLSRGHVFICLVFHPSPKGLMLHVLNLPPIPIYPQDNFRDEGDIHLGCFGGSL